MGVSAARTALVALAGTLPDAATIASLRARHATLVAADGAAVAINALGHAADVVIGDLDSIGELRDALAASGSIIVEESSQELGDFEKALLWLIGVRCTAATVIGIEGGMVDHTLNNFSILARYAGRLELEIVAGSAVGRCVVDSLALDVAVGARVSLIPLPSARLTTRGLAWELRDETLAFGVREGGSNRAVASSVAIDVHEGVVLVVDYPSQMAGSGV
jgi:thiamine pyrophosphokinase